MIKKHVNDKRKYACVLKGSRLHELFETLTFSLARYRGGTWGQIFKTKKYRRNEAHCEKIVAHIKWLIEQKLGNVLYITVKDGDMRIILYVENEEEFDEEHDNDYFGEY